MPGSQKGQKGHCPPHVLLLWFSPPGHKIPMWPKSTYKNFLDIHRLYILVWWDDKLKNHAVVSTVSTFSPHDQSLYHTSMGHHCCCAQPAVPLWPYRKSPGSTLILTWTTQTVTNITLLFGHFIRPNNIWVTVKRQNNRTNAHAPTPAHVGSNKPQQFLDWMCHRLGFYSSENWQLEIGGRTQTTSLLYLNHCGYINVFTSLVQQRLTLLVWFAPLCTRMH